MRCIAFARSLLGSPRPLTSTALEVQGFGFRVLGFGFRGQGLGFRVETLQKCQAVPRRARISGA